MYTLSNTRLEWLGEGLLFKLDSNKHWRAKMQPIFESFPAPLLVHVPNFGELSGSEDRCGGDNSI